MCIVKRNIETPRRAWPVFLLDTSKQIFSSMFLHGYNLLAARALAEEDASRLECEWYFVNFTIDTVGIAAFSYVLIKGVNWALRSVGRSEIHMGKYQSYRLSSEWVC